MTSYHDQQTFEPFKSWPACFFSQVFNQQVGQHSSFPTLPLFVTQVLWCWWVSIIVIAGGPIHTRQPTEPLNRFSTGWLGDTQTYSKEWVVVECMSACVLATILIQWFVVWLTLLLIKQWQLVLLCLSIPLISLQRKCNWRVLCYSSN